MFKYLFFLFIPLTAISQEKIPKKSNTIEVSGVTFKEVVNTLLDFGYTFDKIDSNYQTIKTDFKQGAGKNKWMKLRILVRVKDSIASFSGDWYNTIFMGTTIGGVRQSTLENSVERIEYRSVNPKNCFLEMNEIAISFKKSVIYLIK
jgi:hypothetical protein